jgi:hypothetical protein
MRSGQYERIGQLLTEMEAESGRIPSKLLDEAREIWRPKNRGVDSHPMNTR